MGGHGVHLSPWMHQEYVFRHGRSLRTSAKPGQESLTTGKEYVDLCKTGCDEGRRGQRVSRTGPAPRGRGTEAGTIPTSGQLFGTEEKHLRLLESAAADL